MTPRHLNRAIHILLLTCRTLIGKCVCGGGGGLQSKICLKDAKSSVFGSRMVHSVAVFGAHNCLKSDSVHFLCG